MLPPLPHEFSVDPVQVAYFLAATRDRNPIHVSASAAARAGLTGPIVPGPYGASQVYVAAVETCGIMRVEIIHAEFRVPLLIESQATLCFDQAADEHPGRWNWHLTQSDAQKNAVTGFVQVREQQL